MIGTYVKRTSLERLIDAERILLAAHLADGRLECSSTVGMASGEASIHVNVRIWGPVCQGGDAA